MRHIVKDIITYSFLYASCGSLCMALCVSVCVCVLLGTELSALHMLGTNSTSELHPGSIQFVYLEMSFISTAHKANAMQ